jgi:beta-lactam-binding protein with PASTA domain
MEFLRFIFSLKFIKQLGIAIVVSGLLIWAVLIWMSYYTGHDKYLVVPDLKGKLINPVKNSPAYADFRFVIIDSVYDPGCLPGTIMYQDPWQDSHVKKNRQIYVTVSSSIPEMVPMPDLKYLTVRQAISMLESYGLKMGLLTSTPAFDKDAIQQQLYRSVPIEPGIKIYKGSVIDLVVGTGTGTYEMPAGDSLFSDSLAEAGEEYMNL